ncbi:MAG: tRNA (N(6)-L-threonylcarbamoyladenosine(37)-C(2))-methylthiotran sferase [Candidatus Sumerlaeia bacterium]
MISRPIKVHVESYGCAANMADGEAMAGLLRAAGCELAPSAREADVVVVNSCTVKDRSEWDFRRRVRDLERAGKRLVIAGCIPTAHPDHDLLGRHSVVTTGGIASVTQAVRSAAGGGRAHFLDGPGAAGPELDRVRRHDVIEIVPISQGCLAHCSFCAARLARGDLRSFRPGGIVARVRRAVAEGAREIWLTSQDTAVYGLDLGTNVARLLEAVCAVEGRFMVRLGMGLPNYFRRFLPELLRAMAHPKVYRFLHLPLQSGSRRVLAAMKRPHSVKDVFTVAEAAREALPALTLATDVIVGFPGETDGDFDQTIEALRALAPAVVNRSRFSARPGTPAAALPRLDPRAVNSRSRALSDVVEELSAADNARWNGWLGEALLDQQRRPGSLIARNAAYKPIVVEARDAARAGAALGDRVRLRVTGYTTFHLIGSITAANEDQQSGDSTRPLSALPENAAKNDENSLMGDHRSVSA